jgi:acylphosphatase
MSDLVALHALVFGRVQGVYYRDFVCRHARRLGINGRVCNLHDRSVEVQAEGEREKLVLLLMELNKGPSGARVDNIKSEWLNFTGHFCDFSVSG